MLTVIRNDSFTGVQYPEIKRKIIDFHTNKGDMLVWIDRKLERDEEGNVTEEPTEDDLANEITVDWQSPEGRAKELEEENAELWFDVMTNQDKDSVQDSDISELWYEFMESTSN